jgi:RHS repeat-associated protein
MYKEKNKFQKFLVCILTFIIFCQFTSISALAIPIKIKKNTLSLTRDFSTKPVPEIQQKEKSELAKKILKDDLIQPYAVRELNHTLKSIRDIVEKISQEENYAIWIKSLQAKYESLNDLDKKVKNNLRIRQSSQKERKVPNAVQQKTANLLAHYESNIEPILNRVEYLLKQSTNVYENRTLKEIEIKANFFNAISEFKNYFDTKVTIGNKKPKLAPSPPSFRPSNFKPINPDTSGRVKPAYLLQRLKKTIRILPKKSPETVVQTLSAESGTTTSGTIGILSVTPPNPEDTQETIEVVITQEMRDLVASLNNSPARIFEWVKKNIKVEFYYGSMKGSRGAFIEQAGNDIDTVSLLLALYRAASIPCRYVTGTIELPIEKAKNLTGVDDPQKLGSLIASAGIPATLITSGSEVVAVRMEHTWAEALVDYDPYAGAKAGEGDLWVPLSPWHKPYEYDNGVDLVTMSGFDTESYLNNFISDVKAESPVDLYKIYFEDYLKTNNPGMNWQDGLRTKKIKPEKFRTLPNTLNFEVVSVNGEYAELPDSLRHKITLNVPQVSLSYSFNLSEVVGKKVTYSYPAADEASKSLIDSSGGIENVDPLAVNLLPSIKIEGETVATGSVVNAGYYHNLRTTFSMPGQGSDFVEYSVISGAYYAVGLDPQLVSNKFLTDRITEYISTVGDTPENTDNMDEITGEALYLAVMKYFNDCNTGDTIFAQSLKNVFLKQTSGAITGKNLVVYTLFGTPSDLEPGGYFVDAKRNIYTPISISGDDSRELDFMILGGYNASYHEHNLFEDFFHLEAISTVKLLSIANEQGMPVYDIDNSNITTILPLLGVDASVKSAIQNSVSAGHVVKIHQNNLTVKNWSGSGYVDRDPTTNAAGYIISGGLAGGQTTGEDTGDPEPGPGQQPGNETINDPVNPATGNLLSTEEDFTVPSRGMPISFIRYNNTQSNYDGFFGYGWTFAYDEKVIENPDESLTYMKGNGTRHNYTKTPDSSYNNPSGVYASITKIASGYTLTEKHGIEHFFDTSGKLTSIVDRNGNTIAFAYTGNNLVQITDTVGRTYDLIYNADNRIESVTINVPAPGPYIWTYTYEGNDLISVTGPNGYSRTYTYYPDHNIATLTNQKSGTYTYNYYSNDRVHTNLLPNGGSYAYSYNSPLRVTTSVDPEGNPTNYYYDGEGAITGLIDPYGFEELYKLDENKNKVKITDKNGGGGITKNIYDAMGNLLTTTNQLNYTTAYTYENAYNQVGSIENPMGSMTCFYYDASGNLEKIKDVLNNETTYTYDVANGDLLTTTNAIGVTTCFAYNSYGNLIEKKNIVGSDEIIAAFTYDKAGNLKTATDPEGSTTRYTYQNYNQLKEVMVSHDGTDYITTYEYDENGNRKAVIDAKGKRTESNYNNYNQLESIEDALNNITSFTYDLNGNTKTITNAELHTTTNHYDSLNRLITTEDAIGNTIEYEYDAVGNQTAIIDAKGNKTQFKYNSINRLVKTTCPNGSTEIYSHDKAGNLISEVNRKSEEIRYEYDPLNRLDIKTYPDSTTVDYEYDEISRLLSIVDSDSSVSFEYDDLYRIVKTIQNGNILEYKYNKAGNRTKLIYPNSDYITYEYDGLNRLEFIKDSISNVIADYDYDEINRRTQLSLLNGTQTIYSYDVISQLIKLTNKVTSTDMVISSFDYIYDKVGNRTSMTAAEGTHSYTYNDIYELTQVDYPDGYPFPDINYNLDAVGNRNFTVNGKTTVYSTNNMNQYTDVGGTAYTYDANGNLTNDGVNTYHYDYENRLVQVTTPSDTINYLYDGQGKRIKKSDSSGSTKYIYDGDQVIMETDDSGTISATYVYGTGLDEVLAMAGGGSTYYYHIDGLGSVKEITDSTGSTVEKYQHEVYGQPYITDTLDNPLSESAIGNSYMFAGRRLDRDIGLYYNRARYYDANIGRFINEDPIGFASGDVNLYGYVFNNPIIFTDPDGKALPLLLAGIVVTGGLVGGGIEAFTTWRSGGSWTDVGASYGKGFISGAVGTGTTMGVTALTGGNIVLGGTAGGLAGNLTSQSLDQISKHRTIKVEEFDPISAIASTVLGGFLARVNIGGKIPGMKTMGRLPNIFAQRTLKQMGRNSWRIIGQQAVNDIASGNASKLIDSITDFISGNVSGLPEPITK